ncbi:MAG: Crp/Fnr family transcriptional regulator [Rhizobacter sp.]|nr:Crp/Fnr family transcriptional regulator [Rhizobacter sp.]
MHTLAAQPLLEHLAGGPLPEWATFAAEVQPRTLAAGEALFESDVPWPWLCIVQRGLVKLAYLREDGSERIKSFIHEGGFFASLAALAPGGRTSFTAVALEPCVVEPLSYPRILALGERHLAWQKALRAGIEHYGVRKEKRERELLMLSPEQRYRLFLHESPSLVKRVAQQDIALYLGITPVALSRIRGRMARGAQTGA